MVQGSPVASRIFFDRHWPEARAVSDEQRTIYDAFGLGLGGGGAFLHPGIIWRGVQALFRGHFTGRPHGNVRQMPGMFLVQEQRIVWTHRSRHIADQPDYGTLGRILRSALAGAT
jgi:hypothetical protein